MKKEDDQLIISNGSKETERTGYKLAHELKSGDVVALFGELGSGKTTLIRGVCKGLDVEADITSPTFTLIHEYSGRCPIYHFDFYRIENSQEIWQLGCNDYFYGDGICLIEWADRIPDLLPGNRIEVYLKNRFEEGLQHSREIKIVRR